ncbi:MAG: hypothetical protein J0I09_10560 [Sphingobacteriia bacterium]|nr:hypothetical protein [Sphingobacteriia bacterium]
MSPKISTTKTAPAPLFEDQFPSSIRFPAYIHNDNLFEELCDSISFNKLFTSNDRIMYVAIPEEDNYIGIAGLRQIIGETRFRRNFQSDEPYCCSVYFSNRQIVKVTFSFSNSGKLIEFYR